MKRYIWVVEMLINKNWETTIGVKHTRSAIRDDLFDWKYRNPSDKFRIRKYIPEDEVGNYIVPTGRIK
jgi:hypothetical protein